MIIFASNNKDKIKQVKSFLGKDVVGLRDAGINIDVDEDRETFLENARKKATEIYSVAKTPVIADDSGLCIDYFDGWPGVYTHRFLGENSTERERNQYILNKMKDLKLNQRACHVACALVYIDKSGVEHDFIGQFDSFITFEEKGDNYFGFDSIVYADKNLSKTIAQLSDEEKLKINARGFALEKLQKFLNNK